MGRVTISLRKEIADRLDQIVKKTTLVEGRKASRSAIIEHYIRTKDNIKDDEAKE